MRDTATSAVAGPLLEGSGLPAKLFDRVVVAYDGSASAEDALSLALRLRDPADGHLLLACVLASRPWHRPGRPSSAAAEDEAKAMLAEARAQLPAGIPVAVRATASTSPRAR
jgi:nucleotide-binding universal stress UspA family protein